MKCLSSLEGTRLLVVKGAVEVVSVFSVIALLTWTGLEEKQTGINWTANNSPSWAWAQWFSHWIAPVNCREPVLCPINTLTENCILLTPHKGNLTESLPTHLCSVAMSLCESTGGWERAKLLNRAHAQTTLCTLTNIPVLSAALCSPLLCAGATLQQWPCQSSLPRGAQTSHLQRFSCTGETAEPGSSLPSFLWWDPAEWGPPATAASVSGSPWGTPVPWDTCPGVSAWGAHCWGHSPDHHLLSRAQGMNWDLPGGTKPAVLHWAAHTGCMGTALSWQELPWNSHSVAFGPLASLLCFSGLLWLGSWPSSV